MGVLGEEYKESFKHEDDFNIQFERDGLDVVKGIGLLMGLVGLGGLEIGRHGTGLRRGMAWVGAAAASTGLVLFTVADRAQHILDEIREERTDNLRRYDY